METHGKNAFERNVNRSENFARMALKDSKRTKQLKSPGTGLALPSALATAFHPPRAVLEELSIPRPLQVHNLTIGQKMHDAPAPPSGSAFDSTIPPVSPAEASLQAMGGCSIQSIPLALLWNFSTKGALPCPNMIPRVAPALFAVNSTKVLKAPACKLRCCVSTCWACWGVQHWIPGMIKSI